MTHKLNLIDFVKVKKLEASGVPVALMPTHKSHIDYVVMSIICWSYNVSLPYVAAGENLNIPIIGYILRLPLSLSVI